jgi:hypothetical protein
MNAPKLIFKHGSFWQNLPDIMPHITFNSMVLLPSDWKVPSRMCYSLNQDGPEQLVEVRTQVTK